MVVALLRDVDVDDDDVCRGMTMEFWEVSWLLCCRISGCGFYTGERLLSSSSGSVVVLSTVVNYEQVKRRWFCCVVVMVC